MRFVDVNVLVYAHRSDVVDHELYRTWLDSARRGPEPLGVPDVVASGFLRVVTHPRVFAEPTPVTAAVAFLDALKSAPAVVWVGPGPRHWEVFVDLCTRTGARGNGVPDAYLAALAIEQGATWVSADRGFAGTPGLRWVHPLEARGRIGPDGGS